VSDHALTVFQHLDESYDMQIIEGDGSASEALNWMRALQSDGNSPAKRVLYRGQSRVYGDVFPSLFRPNLSEEEREVWWRATQGFVEARNGVTGFLVRSHHDAIAMVQHYLVRSPVIDVTMTPEVALYFALLGQSTEEMRVVYAIEAEAVEAAGYVVTDHDFLVLPPDQGGIRHRWVLQDGLTIGASKWDDLYTASKLDLLRLSGLRKFYFKKQPEDYYLVSNLGDLETIEKDKLAGKVRSVFEAAARHNGCLEAVLKLMPTKGTVDLHAKLVAEIDELIKAASQFGFSESDITEIQKLREAATGGYWDTAWDCGFEVWKQRVSNRRQ
jgi:FRG domain